MFSALVISDVGRRWPPDDFGRSGEGQYRSDIPVEILSSGSEVEAIWV